MTKKTLEARIAKQNTLVEECRARFDTAEKAYTESKSKANRSEYNKSKFALEQAQKEFDRLGSEKVRAESENKVERKAVSEKAYAASMAKAKMEVDYKTVLIKTMTTAVNGFTPAQLRKLNNDITENKFSESIKSSLDFVEVCFKNMKQEERTAVAKALKISA